jgi:PKD repeat protein
MIPRIDRAIPQAIDLGVQDPSSSQLLYHPGSASVTTQATGLGVDFSATPLVGVAPLTVQFTSVTSGPSLANVWDFGDGGHASQNLNPSYGYPEPGTYTVRLTLANQWGVTEKVREAYITVSPSDTLTDENNILITLEDGEIIQVD